MNKHRLTAVLHVGRHTVVAPLLIAIALSPAVATAADFNQELAALARDRDAAQYDTTTDEARINAFDAVLVRAATLAKQYPNRPEPLEHAAWVLIDKSVVLKSTGSLGLLKEARQRLEAALVIDPNDAGANSTLGSLYFNAPRWPLSYGDKKKGRAYLQKALAIDPTSGWMNLDYAKCLFKDDDYLGAVKYATITLSAPVHAGNRRDVSLHTEAETLIEKAKQHLR